MMGGGERLAWKTKCRKFEVSISKLVLLTFHILCVDVPCYISIRAHFVLRCVSRSLSMPLPLYNTSEKHMKVEVLPPVP